MSDFMKKLPMMALGDLAFLWAVVHGFYYGTEWVANCVVFALWVIFVATLAAMGVPASRAAMVETSPPKLWRRSMGLVTLFVIVATGWIFMGLVYTFILVAIELVLVTEAGSKEEQPPLDDNTLESARQVVRKLKVEKTAGKEIPGGRDLSKPVKTTVKGGPKAVPGSVDAEVGHGKTEASKDTPESIH